MVALAGKERECQRFLIDLMVNEHFLLPIMSQGRLFAPKIPSEKRTFLPGLRWLHNKLSSLLRNKSPASDLESLWSLISLTDWALTSICIQHSSSRKNSFSRKRVTGSVLLFRPRQQGIESTLFASAYEGASTLLNANLLLCSFKVSPVICRVTRWKAMKWNGLSMRSLQFSS